MKLIYWIKFNIDQHPRKYQFRHSEEMFDHVKRYMAETGQIIEWMIRE